jgi:hypothetical protein
MHPVLNIKFEVSHHEVRGDAYASVLKGPRAPAPVYEPRWTVWRGAYGGSNRTTGDLAVIGSRDLSARTVGLAGGLDYRLTPDTTVGFALAAAAAIGAWQPAGGSPSESNSSIGCCLAAITHSPYTRPVPTS